MAAAGLLAAGGLAAYLSAEGWGLGVVLVELAVIAVLVATALRARPVTAAWIPALVAVAVVVIVPLVLPLPTLGVGPRTAAAGAVQLLAVGVVVRHYVLAPPASGLPLARSMLAALRPTALRPTPRMAWLVAVLVGVGLGLVAHALVHFGQTTGTAPLADFWRMGAGDQVSELAGVLVIGVAVEEVLFRLVLAPLSRAALGPWSILFDGALYATLYGSSRSIVWCLVVLSVGTLAAWYRLRYGRFGPVVVAHVVANALAFVILR